MYFKLHDALNKLQNLEEIKNFSREDFHLVKQEFESVINSKARYQQIDTIPDLFKVLEARGFVSCIQEIYKVFQPFVSEVHRQELLLELKGIDNRMGQQNLYQLKRTQPEVVQQKEFSTLRDYELEHILYEAANPKFARALKRIADFTEVADDDLLKADGIQRSFDCSTFSQQEKFRIISKSLRESGRTDLANKLREIEEWPNN